jgi:hypothetical protein
MIDCAGTGDTIIFHPLLANQTLIINAGRMEFSKNLYILSDLTPRVKIQSYVNGAFKILANTTVEFKNINVTGGLSGFPGVAFENYGNLTLWDVIVYKNSLFAGPEPLIYNWGGSAILTMKGTTEVQSD